MPCSLHGVWPAGRRRRPDAGRADGRAAHRAPWDGAAAGR